MQNENVCANLHHRSKKYWPSYEYLKDNFESTFLHFVYLLVDDGVSMRMVYL